MRLNITRSTFFSYGYSELGTYEIFVLRFVRMTRILHDQWPKRRQFFHFTRKLQKIRANVNRIILENDSGKRLLLKVYELVSQAKTDIEKLFFEYANN